MIGFLLFMRARNENHDLRKRLERYEGPPPPPPPTSGKEYLAAFLFVAGLIAVIMLSDQQSAQPPQRSGVVDIPLPRPS